MTLTIGFRPFTRRGCLGAAATALLAACVKTGPEPGEVGQTLTDPAARGFYAARGWRAAWDASSTQTLIQAIGKARAHGLDPKTFEPRSDTGATTAIGTDEALTVAALGYARALSAGTVDPRRIEPVFTLRRNIVDLAAGLAGALAKRDVGSWLVALAPADPEYGALSAAYLAAFGQTQQGAPPAGHAPVGGFSPPADQARQLAINLERRRWLSRTPPPHRIDVNTAAAFMTYLKPGALPWNTRTVVGLDDHQTPSIEASFRRIIANPPWSVPTDIAEKEILPKGPAYLAKEDMSWVDGRLQQAAGPKSALGRVKFDVEDPQDIYLHDTPSRSLFAALDRHRSHGCVRVQDAVGLAGRIAAETGVLDRLDQGLASGDTSEVELGQSIPVRMLYHTAFVDPSGQVLMTADSYGADERLAAALGLGPTGPTPQMQPQALFGP